MAALCLVADAGGTNVRFARSPARGIVEAPWRVSVTEFGSFEAALGAYLERHPTAGPAAAMAIGAAGPVAPDGSVKLTNGPWTFSATSVSATLGGAAVEIVNDLQAVSAALPHLRPDDIATLQPSTRGDAPQRMMAVNVGTGFGASLALAVRHGGRTRWHTVPSEAGHLALAGGQAFGLPTQRFPLSEDALSGRGVPALYAHFSGKPCSLDAASIFQATPDDPIAAQVSRAFATLLGGIAGDLVLATGAWGGAFLCGSVVQGWYQTGDPATLCDAFAAKGRMSDHMRALQVALITRGEPSLFGLTYTAHDLAEAG